ncbi:restriction endonuclease subunit S [Helicobacter cetorum]|uniref:restriction endonuclease subunit S n=1 Tax=Helicobacter cetorum TaxID=138563 RepID=UPI000CF1512C|nr:restriction endonuclease subunit S [Helicobacter cetorum]
MNQSKQSSPKNTPIDYLGEIPKHWGVSKLKYVAKLSNGGILLTNNPNFYTPIKGSGYPFVTIRDMSNTDYVNDTHAYITEQGKTSKNLTLYNKGTLLYSIYASIGKVSELKI